METKKNKQYILLVVIISIMIHIFMLIVIGSSKYRQSSFSKKIEQQILEKKEIDRISSQRFQQKAALTPGSPVWFKNNAPAIIQKAPDHGVNNIIAPEQINSKLHSKNKSKKISVKTKNEKKSSAAKQTVDTKEMKKNIAPNKQKQTTSKAQKLKTQKKAANKKKVVAQEIKKETPTKMIKNNNVQTNKIPPQAVAESLKTKSPISPAKNKKGKFSLKGLQKGFTQYLRQGNNSSISRKGNTNGNPDAEDLKLISYYNQISSTIESAMSAVGRVDSSRFQPDKTPVRYEIRIERDGTISSYRLVKKSKHKELNEHTIKVIENLGSFPPLPSFIKAPHIFRSGFLYFHDPLQFYR